MVEDTPPGISIHDITPQVRSCVAKHFANRRSHQRDGVVHLISRHTTTAVTINEDEALLRKDIAKFLQHMAPPDAEYKHNQLELRPASEKDRAAIERNWMSQGKGTLEEFMAQEPKNAHSHLLAITIGQSETIPVAGGELALGQWQPLGYASLPDRVWTYLGLERQVAAGLVIRSRVRLGSGWKLFVLGATLSPYQSMQSSLHLFSEITSLISYGLRLFHVASNK
ncbi:unnamed protein product [Symbiodinium pilosum]|uniref:Uncharacterized protein n=1 Tax=Symbiodinium pilosum TaxID=2952 RepID=A0A812V8N1_SYMPI|nr:unnamed protein product [Symbiodinium pilosum]